MLMPLHSVHAPHTAPLPAPALLDAAAAPCWIVDRDLILTYANPAMCALLGYRDGEMVGSPLLAFVADESLCTIDRQVAMRDLTPRRTYDMTLVRSDGSLVHTIFNSGTVANSGDALIVVTDISRRHTAEALLRNERDQLTDTIERVNRFLDLLCRDLKEPMSAILGVTQMLPTADMAGCADLCDDAGRQVMRMIENLAMWSRLQLNQMPIDLRGYRVGGVVDDLIEEMAPSAGRRAITLVNAAKDVLALADLSALTAALRHLVDNAVRFSPSGSTVVVSSATLDDGVALSVRDEGVGIPPETLPQLFRLDHTHATPDRDGHLGSGLGLLIAKMLTERMGGSLRLESAPGRGTTATVLLRAARA
ncbi:ATP-binding protein [Azospirillum sp. sgz301742]